VVIKMKTKLTAENLGKIIGTIIIVIVVLITIIYLRFSFTESGYSGTKQQSPTTHTITITEEPMIETLPVNISAHVKGEEMWVEVTVVNGGKDGENLKYPVPPRSQRKEGWKPPKTIGDGLKFRLLPGSNTLHEAELVYTKK